MIQTIVIAKVPQYVYSDLIKYSVSIMKALVRHDWLLKDGHPRNSFLTIAKANFAQPHRHKVTRNENSLFWKQPTTLRLPPNQRKPKPINTNHQQTLPPVRSLQQQHNKQQKIPSQTKRNTTIQITS